MLIRRELPADWDAVRTVHVNAFGRDLESVIADKLREDEGFIPELSFVAEVGGEIAGHVICTRAHLDSRPVLGLGPLGVDLGHQRQGVGQALVHAVIGAADAMNEPLVVLLGDPGYYHRFGFELAARHGIEPPVAEWAPHFQARRLTAYDDTLSGKFRYAKPFDLDLP